MSLLNMACSDDTTSPGNPTRLPEDQLVSSIPQNLIFNGGPGKDGIPALTNPPFVAVGAPGTSYLADDDRVLGLILGSGPIAIPLNIFWWHEIVNLDVGGPALAITHCPLTGSLWSVDGLATQGPLAGQRLQPRADAFVAFWFAWPEFYPEIKIWSEGNDDSTLGRSWGVSPFPDGSSPI